MLALLERTAGSVLSPAQPRCFAAVCSARPSTVHNLAISLLCHHLLHSLVPVSESYVDDAFSGGREHIWKTAFGKLQTGGYSHSQLLPC